ncbi:hypothetical protein [Albimonas donghaensis]|uniref:hypothetical protein n=1 Tax=Albimonas donghaensis TaxID=356660 RepID=UPI00115FDA20|nr:hypothetical protein [Albimonas donghaensis]
MHDRDLRGASLEGIPFEPYDPNIYFATMPDRRLFKEDFFDKTKPLTCFKVTDIWQAARIILAVAGDGSPA